MERRALAAWPHWPWVLWAAYGVALAAALLALPPVAQDPAYHAFADTRALLGIPRFADVASNAALLAAALWGLAVLRRQGAQGAAGAAAAAAGLTPPVRHVHALFFAAVALTALGSAYYHWAPDTPRLLWDRLPLGLVAACFPALVLADRAAPSAGAARPAAGWALAAWLAWGPATALYWSLSEAQGAGDLRPLGVARAVSVLATLALLALLPRRHTLGGAYLLGLGLYALASVCEVYDGAIFAATGLLSGHTLKHLLGGLAVAALAWMLARRRALPGAG
jgi:hypothetical protein